MYFPPHTIPRVPNHSGKPQSGQAYQYGDPGAAIGELKSCTTTYGQDPNASCTFIGTEGIARMTQARGMEICRFDQATYVLESPMYLDNNGMKNAWIFMNGYYQPMFRTEDTVFGPAAELAHAKYWVPKMLELRDQHGTIKIWGAQPRYVEIRKDDTVTVQQLGRVDTVPATDIEVSWEAGDLVLKAHQFYEARFIAGETPNATVLMLLLKVLAGTKPVQAPTT